MFEHPNVRITGISCSRQPWVGSSAELEITLFNEGKKTADECNVVFTDGTSQDDWNSTTRFSLEPNGDELVTITTGKYSSAETHTLDVYVLCDNFQSQHYTRTIVRVE